jgi:protease II
MKGLVVNQFLKIIGRSGVMAEQKKIIIKINHPNKAGKNTDQLNDEIQITEWNIKRILTASSLILLLIVLPYIYLDNSQPSDNGLDSVKTEAEFSSDTDTRMPKSETETVMLNQDKEADKRPYVNLSPENQNTESQVESLVSDPSSQKHYKVVRALLTSGIHDNQPMDEVASPISVAKSKATGIFYYTELTNMKGLKLYHQWLQDGKEKLKTPILVKQDHWRVSTSKLFTPKAEGNWSVRLIDQQGRIYHKLNFTVKNK